MKKRILAILLVVAMLCTLMVGCSSGSNDNDTSTPDTTSTGTSTPADDGGDDASTGGEREKVDGIMYKTGLPIVDEGAYTFSLFVDDSTSTGEFAMMPILQEQTNVVVDLRYLPYESAKERLNLDLNSGDYADCIAGWTLSDVMVMQYGGDGTFIPLEDIYAEYCPRITEILDLPGVREEMTFPDGHIYTIPYVVDDTTVGYSPYINEDWLNKLDLDMPTTTDEFEEVLKAFKTQDPNGNGKADEIPFSTDPNNKWLEAMSGYFGVPLDKEGFTVNDKGEGAWAATSNAYREFLSWFNKLYEEGLIDPEIFTQDSAMWQGKGNQDLYGVSIAYGSNEFYDRPDPKEKGPFSPLPVLNADNGGVWLRSTNGGNVYRTQAVITDNAEHPEIIARWFDNAFSLENGIGINNGPVGIRYKLEGDDMYRKVPDEEFSEEDLEKYGWSNLWPQAVPKYLPHRFNQEHIINDDPDYDEKGQLEQYYEQWLTDTAVPKFFVPEDMLDMYSEYATSINDWFNESQAAFISGNKDVDDDAEWQAYKDQFEKLHLAEYLEARGVTDIIE